MKHTSIALDKLELWFKTAKPGDIAFHFEIVPERYWIYIYREEDAAPCWHLFHDVVSAQKYLDSLGETKMNKRCENCKHFDFVSGLSYCRHEDQAGTWVPKFTCCDKHEPKQKLTGPFDNLKFFVKNTNTGELALKYTCEDCGKVMEKPFYWLVRLPMTVNGKSTSRPGYYFYCEDCNKKKDGKIK